MSDLFSIGASSLRVYQNALTTTSENIANAATPGYSRRSATINEFGIANSSQLAQRVNVTGSGSYVTGVARSADQFRAAEVRAAGADLARTEGGIIWLDRIETSLTGNQLSDRLTAFFNAAKGVAADPAATAPRAVMLEKAQSLATAFTGTGAALASAFSDAGASGTDAATKLSDLNQQLLRTNGSLLRADEGSAAKAGLLDERDRLLEAMSALTDVSVSTDQFGRATVRSGGASGPLMVDGEKAALVTFALGDDGTAAFTAHVGGTTQQMSPSGGTFAGIVDGAAKIAGTRDAIDALAKDFVKQINTLQGQGSDLDSQAGTTLFAYDGAPASVSVTMTDPRKLAAAAVGEGTRGNGNFTALAALRTSAGFETSVDDLTTTNAAALAARRDVASAQTAIRDTAVSAQQAISGVDMDEEAINLIRFQQAYSASSRVVQVARDILQTIIDIR